MSNNLQNLPIRVAFIGAGRMAREHMRAFADIAGVTLAGVAGRRRERVEALAAEFSVGAVFPGVDALIRATTPAIVVIAVPPTDAAEIAASCLDRVPVLLVEKPVGLDLNACRALHRRAGGTDTRVFVGLNRRSYAATGAALADLAGDLTPRFIEVHDQEDTAAARRAGHADPVVRNWMFANSIHMIDYFRLFARGAPTRVEVLHHYLPDCPRTVLASLHFESGDSGLYVAAWNRPGPWACSITTDERRIEMRPMEQARVQHVGSRDAVELQIDAWDVHFKPGLRRQAQQLVDFVRNGTAPRTVPDLADALRTTELVRALYPV